ncbi:inosine/xanthosine triphosphatase [Shewanella dokdonensis]|uniref:inosine/xanthosine triphosphatase n=1 Tax=Shewanella dokdonensis TaxID=712036 RepID=UPI00200FCD78|nr:inosine/xanthosine triphosphatase [Shewanella dokdonensis]MCL1074323.1 inosine/xanthosine triphosphatase [Shewanella dokdonensis]
MKSVIRIVVGSTNPVKINAAKSAVATLHPAAEIICDGIKAPSGVADQPMTDAATRQGALNRVNWCRQHAQADYYLAMEGGVDLVAAQAYTYAWVVIADNHHICLNRSAHLPLPAKVYQALEQGQELGDVMDRMFNTVNVKQAGGAIGLLTQGHASRESTYTAALVMAAAPLRFPELY